jgi:hypothetical protein
VKQQATGLITSSNHQSVQTNETGRLFASVSGVVGLENPLAQIALNNLASVTAINGLAVVSDHSDFTNTEMLAANLHQFSIGVKTLRISHFNLLIN